MPKLSLTKDEIQEILKHEYPTATDFIWTEEDISFRIDKLKTVVNKPNEIMQEVVPQIVPEVMTEGKRSFTGTVY